MHYSYILPSASLRSRLFSANAKSTVPAIEKMYQKKTQREHVLLRPEMYIGSVKPQTLSTWIPRTLKPKKIRMVLKEVNIVPGIYKIFDEILVNAADNVFRKQVRLDPGVASDRMMTYLKVGIEQLENTKVGKEYLITVENDGACIPVELHREENVFVPELIFGTLLTGSNYDDARERFTGGRNGYGAKLTNIFSKRFTVEVYDSGRQKLFYQEFSNNMSAKTPASVTHVEHLHSWTRISFVPDLELFGLSHLSDDTLSIIRRRVFDIAACNPHIDVFLGNQIIPMKKFQDYLDYFPLSKKNKFVSWSPEINWEISVGLSDGEFEQISFINSIATLKGGTHVDIVSNHLVKLVIEACKKKEKNFDAKPSFVRHFLRVFVKGMVANPVFDSQTKETLVTPVKDLPNNIVNLVIPNECEKMILKSTGIVDSVIDAFLAKEKSALIKTSKTKRKLSLLDIPKLEDANFAGTKKSSKCTLIVTEGDSAKALAVAGLSVVGRDFYGVFPLRGKMLNVREANIRSVMANAEVTHIRNIIGLRHDMTYETKEQVDTLRYGKIMLMTDQDPDGSHICGLFVNMLHFFWPALLHSNDFLERFVTPLIKVKTRTGKVDRIVKEFYSIPEFENWKAEQERPESIGEKYDVKYYKGLGTSTPQEAKQYFSDLLKHHVMFQWKDNDMDDTLIKMAFEKDSEARKKWLREYIPENHKFFDLAATSAMSYQDFMNYEFILFSIADNIRSIPSLVDGLKPGLRKVLFGCFKRNLSREIKVAQLAGYVSEQAQYHHGEVSLHGIIVAMAQDFVGANNIALLEPVGQFGTRHMGGKDHASARYIYTKLADVTRKIFRPEDDSLLDYVSEDGSPAEPKYYVPIIPMVLVNGAQGIGSGFSTNIPQYNPKDLIANLRRKLDGEPMQAMDPWYKGFEGTIKNSGHLIYTTTGVINKTSNTSIVITELPIKKWTHEYKATIENIVSSDEVDLKSLREYHTDEKVKFELFFPRKFLDGMNHSDLLDTFKLTSSIRLTNMHLFDAQSRLRIYTDPREIIDEFFLIRLALYKKRKETLTLKLESKKRRLENQRKFIGDVRSSSIDLSIMSEADLSETLRFRGFSEDDGKDAGFSYLTRLPMSSMSKSRFEKLEQDIQQIDAELQSLYKKSPEDLWIDDLDDLSKIL